MRKEVFRLKDTIEKSTLLAYEARFQLEVRNATSTNFEASLLALKNGIIAVDMERCFCFFIGGFLSGQ